jgi:hypothetical protein
MKVMLEDRLKALLVYFFEMGIKEDRLLYLRIMKKCFKLLSRTIREEKISKINNKMVWWVFIKKLI